jgi:hypothetical protein
MKSEVLNIPIELMSYVFEKDIRKPFRLFLYLKAVSSGKLHKESEEFRLAMPVLGINDIRTFDKYIDALLRENWIGYNPATGIFFIRSFKFIRQQHSFIKRRMAQFHLDSDIVDLDAFMFGSIVGDNILRHKDFREMEKKGDGRIATKKRGVAKHILPPSSIPDYFGLSVSTMGKMTGLSQTRAHELKCRAEKAGYMKCNNKFREVTTLKKPDENIKHSIGIGYPELAKKIRIGTKVIGKRKVVVVMEQLYDEVIPMVAYKSYRLRKKIAKKFLATPVEDKKPPLWALCLNEKVKNGNLPPFFDPHVLDQYVFKN